MVYVFVSSERWVNLLVNTLLCGSLVLSLLGALQVMGWDYMTAKGLLPFFTMFVKNLPENFPKDFYIVEFYGFTRRRSFKKTSALASLGMRQSPLGESATEPTFTPSGRQERLNC